MKKKEKQAPFSCHRPPRQILVARFHQGQLPPNVGVEHVAHTKLLEECRELSLHLRT